MMRDEFASTRVIKVSGHKTTETLKSYDKSSSVDKLKMALSVQHGHKTLRTGRLNDLNGMIHPNDPIPGPSGIRSTGKKRTRFEISSDDSDDDKENTGPISVSEPEEAPKRLALPPAIISSQAVLPLSTIPQEAAAANPEFNSLVGLIMNQQVIDAQKGKTSAELVSKLLDMHGASKK